MLEIYAISRRRKLCFLRNRMKFISHAQRRTVKQSMSILREQNSASIIFFFFINSLNLVEEHLSRSKEKERERENQNGNIKIHKQIEFIHRIAV